jgi:hypothetical protein
MNEKLQNFARNELKIGLAQLPKSWQKTFKLMYSHKNPNDDINDIVDRMPFEKLSWAMEQVDRSIKQMSDK